MMQWRKAKASAEYGTCVEIGWRKSSRSGSGDQCVELATGGARAVRDSKNPDGGSIDLSGGRLAALLADVRSGRYDL